jgi:hypothetical protein
MTHLIYGGLSEQDELLLCLKFFLSKPLDFEIIGIKLKEQVNETLEFFCDSQVKM